MSGGCCCALIPFASNVQPPFSRSFDVNTHTDLSLPPEISSVSLPWVVLVVCISTFAKKRNTTIKVPYLLVLLWAQIASFSSSSLASRSPHNITSFGRPLDRRSQPTQFATTILSVLIVSSPLTLLPSIRLQKRIIVTVRLTLPLCAAVLPVVCSPV